MDELLPVLVIMFLECFYYCPIVNNVWLLKITWLLSTSMSLYI